MLGKFYQPGKASFIVGGQWGSEGKGACSAFVARHLAEHGKAFHVVTTNAGVQSGHTSVHDGKKRVFFHLPTYPAISAQYGYKPIVYLNAGSVIDVEVLHKELHEYHEFCQELIIHPNAAIITDEARGLERRDDSAQTKIASTRKGVGATIALKVLRSGQRAGDHPALQMFTSKWYDSLLEDKMNLKAAILVEIPQGYGLGLDAGFYPHCTSRNCTPMQAMADAQIHPDFYGHTMMVIRTYPIRVGNIKNEEGTVIGTSGSCYIDQYEINWELLGVEPELTTVTQRVRRVFTFSNQQIRDAMRAIRPSVVYVTFCDYFKKDEMRGKLEAISWCIRKAANDLNIIRPEIITQCGPSTDDASLWSPTGLSA